MMAPALGWSEAAALCSLHVTSYSESHVDLLCAIAGGPSAVLVTWLKQPLCARNLCKV